MQKNNFGQQDAKKEKSLCFGLVEILLVIFLSVLILAYMPAILQVMGQYSYLGVFLLAIIAHASVIIPLAPLQIGIISAAQTLNPLYVGLLAGIGSAIGELTGYVLGQGSQKMLSGNDKLSKAIVRLQEDAIRKNAAIAIFVLSAVPNPFFDFAGIFAGAIKMKWWKFLLVCAAGRIIRYVALGYFGLWAMKYMF